MGLKSLSDLNYDILRQICRATNLASRDALKSLSSTSKHLRDVTLPDLFENVVIQADWIAAENRLKEMEAGVEPLAHVRRFRFSPAILFSDDDLPSAALPLLLIKAAGRMNRLEKLVLHIPGRHASTFKAIFHQHNVVLPRVDVLAVESQNDFAVDVCPNVTTVAIGFWEWNWGYDEIDKKHFENLMKAASRAPKLTHFAMFSHWNIDQLEGVLGAMPKLLSLSMEGSRYRDPLKRLTRVLAKFSSLQYLTLAAFGLGVTNFQPSTCGNSYMGPEGQQLLEKIHQERKEARELAAQMVLSECKNLRVLWIGDRDKAEVVGIDEGGVTQVKWTKEARQNLCM